MECEADFFISCALHLNRQNATFQAEIIFCTMKPQHFYADCVNELKLDGAAIDECVNGNLGLNLALFAQKESSPIIEETRGVPSVTYNNYLDKFASENSLGNFVLIVNKKFEKLEKYYEKKEMGKDKK
jgi:hypothetical protein